MTNEEIIKGLQAVNEHIGKHFNEGGAWMAEFIDEAIKALEQQPCEDAISREDAIRIASINSMPVNECVRLIKELPSVMPSNSRTKDCEHCIHTYGTLACCDMVHNEWIYDCAFGQEQYKKEHESQPCEDAISREAVVNWLEICTDDSIEHAIESNLEFIPPVKPQPKIDEIIKRIEEARDKDQIAEYPYNRCIKIIREVLE